MKCEIVQDLLSAYCDGACSPETTAAVEEHTAGCPVCSKYLEDCKSRVVTVPESGTPEKPFKKIKRSIFRSKAVMILLAVLLAGVLCGVGFLTYGQVVKEYGCPSFETIIASHKAKKIVKKLCAGDIGYVMDNIEIWQNSEALMFQEQEIQDYCREVLTEFYRENLKGRELSFRVVDCHYAQFITEAGMVPTAAVQFDSGAWGFYMNERSGGKFVMTPYSDGAFEGDVLFDQLCFALSPLEPRAYNEMAWMNNSPDWEQCYTNFAQRFSDDEEDVRAIAAGAKELMDGLTCEQFSYDNFRFDAENRRYLVDMRFTVREDATGKRAVYSRTVQVSGWLSCEVLPEFSPDIIDEGVSAGTRDKLENFLR